MKTRKLIFQLASLLILAAGIYSLDLTLTGGGLIAMAVCGKITTDSSPDCDNPLQGGTDDIIILINWDDMQDAIITRNGTNPQIVEGITLPSGVRGYLMEGKNNSVLPLFTYVKQRFAEVFNHRLNYKIFRINAEAKELLEKKVLGRFVAVIQNKYRGSDGSSAFEILGLDAGLVVPDGGVTRDPNSTDTQGAYDVILETDEFSKEPHLPATLFLTNYATTKAIFDGLAV